MPTPKKKWPHEADWARIDSIAAAQRGQEAIEPLFRNSQDIEVVRGTGTAIHCFWKIIDSLKSVGVNSGNNNSNDKG